MLSLGTYFSITLHIIRDNIRVLTDIHLRVKFLSHVRNFRSANTGKRLAMVPLLEFRLFKGLAKVIY